MFRHLFKRNNVFRIIIMICAIAVLSGGSAVSSAAKSSVKEVSAQNQLNSQMSDLMQLNSISLEDGNETAAALTEIYPQYKKYNGEMEGVSVSKVWTGDAEYNRPDSVTFDLYLDNQAIDTLVLTADDNWTGSFAGHYPAYKLDSDGNYVLDDDGNRITLDYQVKERAVDNYTAAYSQTRHQTTVDSSAVHLFVPATELKEGEQYIAVSSNQAGTQKIFRSEAYQTNGMLSSKVTVSDGTIKDKNGNSYSNYILMNDGDGTYDGLLWNAYSTGNSSFYLFSNVYEIWGECHGLIEMKSTQSKMTVPHVSKQGSGTDVSTQGFYNTGRSSTGNAYKTADSSEEIYLYKEVVLPDGAFNSWQTECTVSNRYNPPITVDPDSSAASEKTDMTVTKKWENDSESDRPSEITVYLYANGVNTGKSLKLNAENNWSASFKELDAYNAGKAISYSVYEDVPEGYSAEYKYENTDSNTEVENETGSRTKGYWVRTDKLVDGETYLIVTSPDSGQVTGMEILESGNGFKWTENKGAGTINVEGAIIINGQTYATHITQEEAAKHTRMQWTAHYNSASESPQTGYHNWFLLESVSNPGCYPKFNGQGDISDGSAHESLLYYGLQYKQGSGGQNGYVALDDKGNTQITPTVENYPDDFNYVFGNHDHYFLLTNNGTGDANAVTAQTFYLYKFVPVSGPSVMITNTKSEKTSLAVYKNWNDDNDKAGARPDKIDVELLKNGKETGSTAELSSENNWKYTFENLIKTDEYGKDISYSVKEISIPDGYTGFVTTGTVEKQEENVEYTYAWVPVTQMKDGGQYILAGGISGSPATIGAVNGKSTLSGTSVNLNTDATLTGEDGNTYTAFINDNDASYVTIWTAHGVSESDCVTLETGNKYLEKGESNLQDNSDKAAQLKYDAVNHALKASKNSKEQYMSKNGDFNSSQAVVTTYLYERVKISNTVTVDTTQSVAAITNTYCESKGEFIIQKEDGNTGNKLSGEFKFTLKDGNDSAVGNYSDVQVDSNGQIRFEDIPYGDYILEETAAPDDYAKLPVRVEITVSKDGIQLKNTDKIGNYAALDTNNDGICLIRLKNFKWVNMPETGSRGKLDVMLLGAGLLIAGALFYLLNRRKGDVSKV